MNSQLKPPRNSSIELLRLIACLMVITIHYIGFGTDFFEVYSASYKINIFSGLLLESLGIGAVNIFMLISGYCNITNKSIIRFRKVIDILIISSFWSILCYAVSVLTKTDELSVNNIITYVFPYFFGKVWYVNVYITFVFIAPVLNLLVKDLNKKSYSILIIVLLIVFSVVPFIFGHRSGYDIIQYTIMYLIGGYFAINKTKKYNCALLLALFCAFSAATFYLIAVVGSKMNIGKNALYYSSVFVICASVSIFLIFTNYNFHSATINKIAKSTLSIYLLNVFCDCKLNKRFYEFILVKKYETSYFFFIHIFISVVLFFVIALILDILRQKLFEKSIGPKLDKLSKINSVFSLEKVN